MLDVYCCMEGGKKGIAPMCPHGIAWNVCLGEDESGNFDPNGFLVPYPIKAVPEDRDQFLKKKGDEEW